MTFAANGYEVIKNAIENPLLKVAQDYYNTLLLQDKFKPIKRRTSVPDGAFDRYCDALTTTIAELIHPVVEKCTGLTLLPTYNYTRVYPPGTRLVPHTDRHACEISATLTVSNTPDEVWPIFLRLPTDTTVRVDLNPGDMMIYRGMDLPHWRDAGNVEQTGIFLHWIDANGPFTEHQGDLKHRDSPRNLGVLAEKRRKKELESKLPVFDFK